MQQTQGANMGARHPDARERRIARDEDSERVRSALRAGARHGFYVFDNLMTDEAGMLDYLTVGPEGITAIVVRGEHGDVQADPETGDLHIIREPFKDDPRKQAIEQHRDVAGRMPDFVPAYFLVCFTRAEIKIGGNPEAHRGLYHTWNLHKIFQNEVPVMNEATVTEIAKGVENIYSRPPFVRPAEPYGGSTIKGYIDE